MAAESEWYKADWPTLVGNPHMLAGQAKPTPEELTEVAKWFGDAGGIKSPEDLQGIYRADVRDKVLPASMKGNIFFIQIASFTMKMEVAKEEHCKCRPQLWPPRERQAVLAEDQGQQSMVKVQLTTAMSMHVTWH